MNIKSRQRGATLVELMIGLALSLIVTTSMVGLMSNSLGTATRVIQMSQLTDEMRNSMSMLTRDVRRANYSAHAIYCYSNPDCGSNDTTTLSAVTIVADGTTEDCVLFNVDRKQNNFNETDVAPGAFRRSIRDSDDVGFMEMWVGGAEVGCGDPVGDGDWYQLTDPDFVDIRSFEITTTEIEESAPGSEGITVHQMTTNVKFIMIGALRLDPSIERRIEDSIKIRNDYVWTTTPTI